MNKYSLYNTPKATSTEGECKGLISFDYKGVGSVTFRYILCGDDAYTEHTFTDLENSGGEYFTYEVNLDDIVSKRLCIEGGSFEYIGGTILNINTYVYCGTCL